MDAEMETQKTYTFEEAVEASNRYFNGDALAAQVWVSKYALKDSDGNIYELTPDDMHRRLANELARIEANYPEGMSSDEIFELYETSDTLCPRAVPWPE